LYSLDSRFEKIKRSTLDDTNYVPFSIQFPYAVISAAPSWPRRFLPLSQPTKWSKWDGANSSDFAPELSDQLWATYPGVQDLALTDCKGELFIRFSTVDKAIEKDSEITLVNQADALGAEFNEPYRDLVYLLWYNRLGNWNGKECPDYKNDAVLLRCQGTACNYYLNEARNTTFWPVMMNK
jgi:hypothetical protein